MPVAEGEFLYNQYSAAGRGIIKTACAYMVYKAVEKQGEIIKTHPSMQAMEEEIFDLDFSFLLLGKPDLDINELQKSIENIAEIEKVTILSVDFKDQREAAVPEEEAQAAVIPAKEKEEFRSPVEEAIIAVHAEEKERNPASEADTDNISRSVTKARPSTLNRFSEKTVRVETAKLDALVNLVGELIINRTRVLELGKQIKNEQLEESLEQLERITTEPRVQL